MQSAYTTIAANVGSAYPWAHGPMRVMYGYDASTVGIVFTGARPGEKLHEQLAYDTEAIRPTSHPDIHVWEQPVPDPAFIDRTVATLSPTGRGPQSALVAETVRRLVGPASVAA